MPYATCELLQTCQLVVRYGAGYYLLELDALELWIQQQVATVPRDDRKLVTFHEAYRTLPPTTGFELIGVIAPSPCPEHEPIRLLNRCRHPCWPGRQGC